MNVSKMLSALSLACSASLMSGCTESAAGVWPATFRIDVHADGPRGPITLYRIREILQEDSACRRSFIADTTERNPNPWTDTYEVQNTANGRACVQNIMDRDDIVWHMHSWDTPEEVVSTSTMPIPDNRSLHLQLSTSLQLPVRVALWERSEESQ